MENILIIYNLIFIFTNEILLYNYVQYGYIILYNLIIVFFN